MDEFDDDSKEIGRDRDIANFQKISNNSRKVSHDW